MAETFPPSLPAPLRAGYTIKDQSRVRSSNVQKGPPRFELLSANAPSSAKVTWNLTEADFNTFEDFFFLDSGGWIKVIRY